MGNSSSKNEITVDKEKYNKLLLTNKLMKDQINLLQEHIFKEGRLIDAMKENIYHLKNRSQCVSCEYKDLSDRFNH